MNTTMIALLIVLATFFIVIVTMLLIGRKMVSMLKGLRNDNLKLYEINQSITAKHASEHAEQLRQISVLEQRLRSIDAGFTPRMFYVTWESGTHYYDGSIVAKSADEISEMLSKYDVTSIKEIDLSFAHILQESGRRKDNPTSWKHELGIPGQVY